MTGEKFEVYKTVYQEDCNFYRHQDQLKWSRFKTMATIEGALLLGIFGEKVALIAEPQKLIFAIFASLLVLIVSLLAVKDEFDADCHEQRMKEFEKDGIPFETKRPFGFLTGTSLMYVAIVVIYIFNAIIIYHLVVS